MTRAVAAAAALAAAALAAALGGAGLACRSGDDALDPGETPEPLPPQSRAADQLFDDKAGFTAVLTPRQQADVVAPYTSASASLRVKLGDSVEKGQVIAQLDDRQLQQELDAARAQLRTAQAQIGQAVTDERGAQIVLDREVKAAAADVASPADVVNARQAVAKAHAAIAVATAAAAERKARIDQLQAHLQEMKLTAPIGGSIATQFLQDGARVEEGRPVVRIISGGVFVKFAIPADKAGVLKVGDTVELRLQRRTAPLTATVAHVSPELDGVAQMIFAEAELVSPPADLQPGTVGRILPRAK
jgi:RND family efflux transporter MFP subunit